MRLSIIVPMLNEIDMLPALLAHLLYWQRRGCEVLLVDGGSSDGSAEVAKALGFAVSHADRGRARQMNAGARLASGDVLLFLHADTRLPEQADAAIRRALGAGRRVWGRFDVSITGSALMLRVIAMMMNLRSRLSGIATGDQAIFVTREAFERLGGFADQPLMEDIELCSRLRGLSAPVCLREKAVTSGRRWEARGVGRTILLMWRLRWAYWRGAPADVLAERYQ